MPWARSSTQPPPRWGRSGRAMIVMATTSMSWRTIRSDGYHLAASTIAWEVTRPRGPRRLRRRRREPSGALLVPATSVAIVTRPKSTPSQLQSQHLPRAHTDLHPLYGKTNADYFSRAANKTGVMAPCGSPAACSVQPPSTRWRITKGVLPRQ